MMTTIKAGIAALLRALGASWAVRLADYLDPPATNATPDGAGGAGPTLPPPKPKRWWWPL